MKKNSRFLMGVFCFVLCPAFFLRCTSSRFIQYDDALDIKPDRQFAYEVAPCPDTASPDGARRDGRTLRGTVQELVILEQAPEQRDTFFLFINRGVASPEDCIERIPLRDILLPALDSAMVRNKWNNINKIRSYNNVTGIPEIREVPVRVVTDCECDPLSFTLPRPRLGIRCTERNCSPIFIELRAIPGLFSYADHPTRRITEYRKAFVGEIAIGWRFGMNLSMAHKLGLEDQPCGQTSLKAQIGADFNLYTDFCYRWGIGLAFTSPLGVYNALSSTPPTDVDRPVGLLHVRYQFDRILSCIRPFLYAQLGTALDSDTRKLWRYQISGDADIDAAIEEIDTNSTCWNLFLPYGTILPSLKMQVSTPPLTWGFGVGLEFPLFNWLDLAADIGYRSLGIADVVLYQNTEIPVPRRVGLWRLRIGVTL